MYSGMLQLNCATDDMIKEVTAVSDYFQMAGLKESLDQKLKNQVDSSNVFHWAKVADMYNLPQLTSLCDRIQLLKFKHVVEHKEFCELPKDEVLTYIKKCKEYSGIGNDDLLTAALKWVDNNEPFPELIQEIDLDKCSQVTLKAVKSHPAIPQNSAAQNEEHVGAKQEKETLAYISNRECVFEDQHGEMRQLDKFIVPHDALSSSTYGTCYTHDGYVCIEEVSGGDNTPVFVSISKYDAVRQQQRKLPGAILSESTTFSIVHKEKLYMIGKYETGAILIYDLKKCGWFKLPLPKECRKHIEYCTGAVVGEELFFMDNRLHLFRVGKNKLERIQTSITRTKAKEIDSLVPDISLAAVHRWLYIFTKESGVANVEVNCYDTALGTWTDIPVSFSVNETSIMQPVSSVMFENTIYFLGHVACYFGDPWEPALYEYDLLNGTVKESRRSLPRKPDFIHVSVIDVTKRLEQYSNAPKYSDSDRESASDSEDSDFYSEPLLRC